MVYELALFVCSGVETVSRGLFSVENSRIGLTKCHRLSKTGVQDIR